MLEVEKNFFVSDIEVVTAALPRDFVILEKNNGAIIPLEVNKKIVEDTSKKISLDKSGEST